MFSPNQHESNTQQQPIFSIFPKPSENSHTRFKLEKLNSPQSIKSIKNKQQFLQKMKSARQKILSNKKLSNPSQKSQRNVHTNISLSEGKKHISRIRLQPDKLQNKQQPITQNKLRECRSDFTKKIKRSVKTKVGENISFLLKKQQVQKQLQQKSMAYLIYITDQQKQQSNRSAKVQFLERLNKQKNELKKISLSRKKNRYMTIDMEKNMGGEFSLKLSKKNLSHFRKIKDQENQINSLSHIEITPQNIINAEEFVLPPIKTVKKKPKMSSFHKQLEKKRIKRQQGCVGTKVELQQWTSKRYISPKRQQNQIFNKNQKKLPIPQFIGKNGYQNVQKQFGEGTIAAWKYNIPNYAGQQQQW